MTTPETKRPDGPLTSLLFEFSQQLAAAERHAAAEGHSADARTVLESYDRTLHPWMHGRRPEDIAEKIRTWWHSIRPSGNDAGGAA